MPSPADLATFLRHCRSLDWNLCQPRRSLHLGGWQEDWDDNLAMLESAEDDDMGGEDVAQLASTLLRQALDRGLPAQALRPRYLQVVALWLDYAQQCRGRAPIDTATDGYQFALQLLSLAVLLDAQEQIPAICEQLLHHQTDRLLDYLSAAATDKQEANESWLHAAPFAGLDAFFEQYGEVHAQPLLPYLEAQYTRFFAMAPKEQKRQPRLTGPQAWGWWALEVAALVVLYELDDSALRAHRHYPADLVDHALGRLAIA